MASRQFHLHSGQKGAAVAIRVTPRARKNEIVEVQSDGTVRVRLTAAPNESKANEELLAFLAQVLETPVTKLEIVAGTTGRDKLVSILDLDVETVHRRILAHIA